MNRLRSIAFTALIALTAVIMTVIFLPALFMGENAARWTIRLWSRFSLGAMKALTGVDYKVEGRENIPAGSALVVSNHQSLWETIAFQLLLPRAFIVLKKELLRVPIYGIWVKAAGNIVIDRSGGARALREMREKAAARIAEGAQVVIFPEGTRLKAGETGPYQPGVAGVYAAAGAPCHPVAHDSGRFWRKLGGALTPGTITIRFLPPISAGVDRKAFQKTIQAAIEAGRPDLDNQNSAPVLETADG
jgi:1-acyl-sn-glycerol-3-phosphate acyltransferase